jgi:hypothetical protein
VTLGGAGGARLVVTSHHTAQEQPLRGKCCIALLPIEKLRWNHNPASLLILLPPHLPTPELTPWIIADLLVVLMKRCNAGEEEKSVVWIES